MSYCSLSDEISLELIRIREEINGTRHPKWTKTGKKVTPPNRGIGQECTLRTSGISNKRFRKEMTNTRGMITNPSMVAITKPTITRNTCSIMIYFIIPNQHGCMKKVYDKKKKNQKADLLSDSLY